jgi:hypothetical protein
MKIVPFSHKNNFMAIKRHFSFFFFYLIENNFEMIIYLFDFNKVRRFYDIRNSFIVEKEIKERM